MGTLRAGLVPATGKFFFIFNDDGGALLSEVPNPREQSDRECERKVQSRGSKATKNANAKPEGAK